MGDGPTEGATTINLDRPSGGGTCIVHRVIIHEVFHALGLAHEHMRYDRDHFLRVIQANVDPSETQWILLANTI